MPRGPRIVYKNAFLVVTSRGNNKRILFRKEKDYKYFRNLLIKYKTKYKLTIYHYCFMRNHVHLLLKIDAPISLSRAMHGLQLSYFQYFSRRYGYVGRLWQGRFHSKPVNNDRYLLTAGLYIEGNPVRAKVVNYPDEYKWSSYNAYAGGEKDLLIEPDPYYLGLGDNEKQRQARYIAIMNDYLKSGK